MYQSSKRLIDLMMFNMMHRHMYFVFHSPDTFIKYHILDLYHYIIFYDTYINFMNKIVLIQYFFLLINIDCWTRQRCNNPKGSHCTNCRNKGENFDGSYYIDRSRFKLKGWLVWCKGRTTTSTSCWKCTSQICNWKGTK